VTRLTFEAALGAPRRRAVHWRLLALVPAALALNGCVAGLALSAAEMAAQSAQGTPTNNTQLKPQAADQCAAQAAHYGTPHIIDVQQANIARIIVWGTVDDGPKRLSFECVYGTKIKSFTLPPIKTVTPAPGQS
jgi:hypothetical protein